METQESQFFFDPSLPYGTRVADLHTAIHFHGLQIFTTKDNLYRDAVNLARDFSQKGDQIQSKKSVDAYASITFQPDESGQIRYFLGRQTNQNTQMEGFVHVVLEPGLYAALKVRNRPGWYLPYRLARLRQGFHQTFLPATAYRQSEVVDEIEYYNAESRRKYFERPAMYLLFPLEQLQQPKKA